MKKEALEALDALRFIENIIFDYSLNPLIADYVCMNLDVIHKYIIQTSKETK